MKTATWIWVRVEMRIRSLRQRERCLWVEADFGTQAEACATGL